MCFICCRYLFSFWFPVKCPYELTREIGWIINFYSFTHFFDDVSREKEYWNIENIVQTRAKGRNKYGGWNWGYRPGIKQPRNTETITSRRKKKSTIKKSLRRKRTKNGGSWRIFQRTNVRKTLEIKERQHIPIGTRTTLGSRDINGKIGHNTKNSRAHGRQRYLQRRNITLSGMRNARIDADAVGVGKSKN